MASWMIHLRVADKLLDKLQVTAQTEFVVGNIAPDSGLPDKEGNAFTPSREVSHFNTTDAYGIKVIHEDIFVSRYYTPKQRREYSEKQKAFYLGYLTHLLTDKLWVRDIVQPSRERFAALFREDQGAFWKLVKRDWQLLDFLYLKSNPAFRAFCIYEDAAGFENVYLDFFSKDAFDDRRASITAFYRRESAEAEHTDTYLTEEEMTAFVEKAAEEIAGVCINFSYKY